MPPPCPSGAICVSGRHLWVGEGYRLGGLIEGEEIVIMSAEDVRAPVGSR